jgi:GntR family transcriptional repressor for pyruvate dehydrogenase complex
LILTKAMAPMVWVAKVDTRGTTVRRPTCRRHDANRSEIMTERAEISGVERHRPDVEAKARWRPVNRARTYELVIDRVEEQILTGELRVGDRLPAERDLAALLGVSRSAVREAMRTLEALGVVQSGVGTGPDSGTIITALSSEALTRLLRLHVGLVKFPMIDIVEARVMLERWSARLAAAHATQSDLDRLARLLDMMEDAALARGDFNDLDTSFHVAIAEAGGNRLVADMTTAIRGSLRHGLLIAFETFEDWPCVANDLRRDHRGIYDALAARDADKAEVLIEAHIRTFFERQPV